MHKGLRRVHDITWAMWVHMEIPEKARAMDSLQNIPTDSQFNCTTFKPYVIAQQVCPLSATTRHPAWLLNLTFQ